MDNSFRLLDLTVYGRQETWEDSPFPKSMPFHARLFLPMIDAFV